MPPSPTLPGSMAPGGLDFRRRAELSEWMDEPCSREVMRACLRDLARVNRWFLGYRPTLKWLEAMVGLAGNEPVRILDVGCGYGDALRQIERWARERLVAVELTGVDLNSDSVALAAEASGPDSAIQWIPENVFDCDLPLRPHLIVSSLFAHHLMDEDVVRFLRWMEMNAELGWFINDLSRAPVPYHLFRWFSKAAGLHPFVQHDGPVSFLRAFVPDDWRRLCAAAGLERDAIEIVSHKPARLCVSRRSGR